MESVTMKLPHGWDFRTAASMKWTSEILVQTDMMAFKNGTTWVAMGDTGTTTMQGNPITPEHFQAMAALAELKGIAIDGAAYEMAAST
jgi:hypothetical protein